MEIITVKQLKKEFKIDTDSEVCEKCGGLIEFTPHAMNSLIGTCQKCGTTYPWLNLKEKKK
ncbi:hypothetical protein KKH36_02365 [Patescibacteria group bacterium]|nr:hypothetical protein [Patescibacteria group bacterium]